MQPASFRRYARYNWVAVWALIRVEARAFGIRGLCSFRKLSCLLCISCLLHCL